MPTLLASEAVHVFDREYRSPRAPREDRNTAFETHIRARDPPEQSFDELIDSLAHLVRSEARVEFGDAAFNLRQHHELFDRIVDRCVSWKLS